jgi:uncharacterized protein YndB with AHSA1/START domain
MSTTAGDEGTDHIVWRLRLAAAPERVFDAWVNPADHMHYWCERSEPLPGGFRLHFIDGTIEDCTIEGTTAPSRIVYRYFGSRVDIRLELVDGGTDLTLTASDVPRDDWHDVYAGWLNVLLPLKAWVDFGIDLRNHDPRRTWRNRYVDQ